MNSGTTVPFTFFSTANDPFFGLFDPSAHMRNRPATPSIEAHLLKSASGIAFLLSGVSKTSLKI